MTVSATALIREARIGARLTQAELAQRLGISQAAVARLEGPRSNPTIRTLERVLRATGRRLALETHPSAGVDASLIRRHLALTPAERVHELEQMQASAHALAAAGERSRAGAA